MTARKATGTTAKAATKADTPTPDATQGDAPEADTQDREAQSEKRTRVDPAASIAFNKANGNQGYSDRNPDPTKV